MVPCVLYFFVGTSKAGNMTENKTSKAPKRDDLGDVFTNEELPEKIGKNLREIYDNVVNEPVPDDFLNLLSKADEKTG